MKIPDLPDVSAILNRKIAEIQSRLPIKMKTSTNKVSFSEELNKATASAAVSGESAAPVIDPSLLTGNTKNNSKTNILWSPAHMNLFT